MNDLPNDILKLSNIISSTLESQRKLISSSVDEVKEVKELKSFNEKLSQLSEEMVKLKIALNNLTNE